MSMAGTILATKPQPAPTATPGRVRRVRRALAERRTRYGLLNAAPVVVYLLILFVYPIFSTLLLSLKGEQGGWTLHWYADAFQGPTWRSCSPPCGSPPRPPCSAWSSASCWPPR